METEQERQVTEAARQPHAGFDQSLVLASASPRRAEILRATGWRFTQVEVDVDEARRPDEEPVAYVERLALTKAEAGAARHPADVVLGADTVVLVDEDILGKPADEDHAREMLQRLSGRWHQVLTGVALVRTDRWQVAHELTRVKFAAMTANEIEWYLASGEAMGKAGAYAIQGKAARFIKEIQGDYLNVVGLPVRLLYRLVLELSLPTSPRKAALG